MAIHTPPHLTKNLPAVVYFLSTLFMIFASVHAIQQWPSLWAQVAISLTCILPALLIFPKILDLTRGKAWPIEIKFTLVIVTLGVLNILFSEDRLASFKGMGLFLMSGILIFNVSYYLFKSRQTQSIFLYLCAFCFIIFLAYGTFEFIHSFNDSKNIILLFSSNPIPAGSLLVLLSIGPLILLEQSKSKRQSFLWIFCLLASIALIILTVQRSTAIAIFVVFFFLLAIKQKKNWVFITIILILIGIGSQFRDKISPQYKNRLLNKETILVRMEYYHVALDILKNKPLFGIGFNSSLKSFIPYDYVPKIYPPNSRHSFHEMVAGLMVFDNMILSLIGEAGGLFAMAYIGLIIYLFSNTVLSKNLNSNAKIRAYLLFSVMAGFLTLSIAFDSLKNPQLNWIFHSLLGLAANCRSFDHKTNEKEKISPE